MAKKGIKKIRKKIKEKKYKPEEEEIEEKTSSRLGQSEEEIEEKIPEEGTEKIENSGEEINPKKFMEFLSISTEPMDTLASKKPNNAKSLEQNEEVLSFIQNQEKDKKNEKEESGYAFSSRGEDYNLAETESQEQRTLFKDSLLKAEALERMNMEASKKVLRGEGTGLNPGVPAMPDRPERNYTLKEDLLDNEVKYKSRRFR